MSVSTISDGKTTDSLPSISDYLPDLAPEPDSEAQEQPHLIQQWANDGRVGATERKKILSYGARRDDPQNGEANLRKARDIYAQAVLTEAEVADRKATLLVNRVLDPILKCGHTYGSLDVAAAAAAIRADPTSNDDFLAAAKVAYDVLEKVDMISELVSGRPTALVS